MGLAVNNIYIFMAINNELKMIHDYSRKVKGRDLSEIKTLYTLIGNQQ